MLKDLEGLEVDLEILERKVNLGLLGLPVGMDNLDCLDHKDHRDPEEQRDLQV